MSRVGKAPISVPDNTKIKYKNRVITVESTKGVLTKEIHPAVDLVIEERMIRVDVIKNTRPNRALRGLTRSLVANMVTGVTKGFQRELEVVGVGYRAELQGRTAVFNLGYSHPIHFELPEGIDAKIEKTKVVLSGIDKELVGLTAAKIRSFRKPESYKGKGVRYAGEVVRRKAGKAGSK